MSNFGITKDRPNDGVRAMACLLWVFWRFNSVTLNANDIILVTGCKVSCQNDNPMQPWDTECSSKRLHFPFPFTELCCITFALSRNIRHDEKQSFPQAAHLLVCRLRAVLSPRDSALHLPAFRNEAPQDGQERPTPPPWDAINCDKTSCNWKRVRLAEGSSGRQLSAISKDTGITPQ